MLPDRSFLGGFFFRFVDTGAASGEGHIQDSTEVGE
jgi:hypothetical protein